MIEVEVIGRQAEAWGLSLDDDALEALLGYAKQLSDYHEANIVGVKDLSQLLLEHVLDSLSCLLCEPVRQAERLVDVGSGGGLPGVPLKIVQPEMDLTLLEATGKKARFLEKVVGGLALRNTEIVNARAEEVGRLPSYRDKYDVATARAVAPLSTLCEYCLPLVKEGGCLVAMKALPDKKEVESGRRAAETLGAEVSELIEVEFIPEILPKQRHLVVMTKVSETPHEYPRRTGIPKKSPLGSN